MTVEFQSGQTKQGLLLARTENTMRVALEDTADTMEITNVNGVWVTDDCEPVRITFAWQAKATPAPVEEADCICSPELAARLTQMLFAQEEERVVAASRSAAQLREKSRTALI